MNKTMLAAIVAATTLGLAAGAEARQYRGEDSLSSNDIQANASTNDTRGNAAIRSTGSGIKYGTANRPDAGNDPYYDRYYAPSAGYYDRYGYNIRNYSGVYGSRKDSIYNDRFYVTSREYGLYQHPPMGNAQGLETGDDTRR